MIIEKLTVPFGEANEILEHLADIFGEKEREIESEQLLGRELESNTDIVIRATDGKKLLGAVHATIPKSESNIAGLSAMFTTPESRGLGIGKMLFGAIVSELERMNVTAMFLGTGEPIAEKLYASFGFRYLYGSGVMIRLARGGPVDYFKERYSAPVGKITVSEGSAVARIPIIPLALLHLSDLVYDVNLELVNPCFVTQRSCMGLYPKYIACRRMGGNFFSATDEKGTLGAMATIMPITSGGYRFDVFSCPSFENSLHGLLECAKHSVGAQNSHNGDAKIYMDIANADKKKQITATSLGFTAESDSVIRIGEFSLESKRYLLNI